jgi:putative ABC transport system substrate-binding protein
MIVLGFYSSIYRELLLRRPSFFTILITHLFLCWLAFPAQSNDIAIFYPNVSEPYKSIYQEIVSGVESGRVNAGKEIPLAVFTLAKNFDSQRITQQLNDKGIKKVLVLGRSGLRLARALKDDFTVISGALPITPNTIAGISLIADPEYLFKYLAQVAPKVNTIHVAYSNANGWLINLAKSAAISQGYELDIKKVDSTKQALEFYQQLFTKGLSEKDAIWLPIDRISSQDKVTLPFILEKAWNDDIVVFSSKPSHAKRGALFSTYPDNYGLGQQLYKMINEYSIGSEPRPFSALISTLLAVNLRTAAHLGFKYDQEQQKSFQLTFPE